MGSVKLKIELWVSLERFCYHQDADGAVIHQARRKNDSRLQFSALMVHCVSQFIIVMRRNWPDLVSPVKSSADQHFFCCISG